MSKHSQRHITQPIQQPAVPQAAKTPDAPAIRSPRKVEEHRRCPICWGERGGVGIASSSDGQTRYYKCRGVDPERPDGFPCGFTWKVIVKTQIVAVESRPVIIDGTR